MVVVDAVDDPVQARAEAVLGLEVEDEPMQPVLEQCPQRVAGDRQRAVVTTLALESSQAAKRITAGVKISTGTAGCTRERTSSRRESNIGGEARSTSVLLAGDRRSCLQPTPYRRFYYPFAVCVTR